MGISNEDMLLLSRKIIDIMRCKAWIEWDCTGFVGLEHMQRFNHIFEMFVEFPQDFLVLSFCFIFSIGTMKLFQFSGFLAIKFQIESVRLLRFYGFLFQFQHILL